MLEPDEFEPGVKRGGWQHEASSRVGGSTGKKCSSNGCCVETEHVCDSRVVGWEFGLDLVSHFSFDEDSTALVQGGAVASPPSPTSSFSAYVRLWPPNRLVWPPPRFVHQDGGVGAAGIRTRECCGARV